MKRFESSILATLITLLVYSHEPNEAFFTFHVNADKIAVEAELPSTMQHALIQFNAALEHAVNESSFEETFKDYLEEHLVLEDENGDTLKIDRIEEV